MRTADLEAEWRTAQAAITPNDALTLALWLPQGVIIHMIGIAKARVSGGCYEPDTAGKWAYISPARSATQNCCGGWGANQRRPERDAGSLIDQYGPQQLCAIPAGGADGVTRAGCSGPTAAAPFAPIAATSPARCCAIPNCCGGVVTRTDVGLEPAEAAHPTLAVGTVIRAAATSPYTDWHYPWAVLGGELIDLICWDIDNPRAWASRCGSAEWLGCASRNEPTTIRRSPVDWLGHRCSGLVLLTEDRVRQYEILTDCNDIVAEDEIHADQLNELLAYPYPRKPIFLA